MLLDEDGEPKQLRADLKLGALGSREIDGETEASAGPAQLDDAPLAGEASALTDRQDR
jgi:hypothetical protein